MKSRRKSAPAGPEDLARLRAKARLDSANPATWGIEPAALALEAHQSVRATFGARRKVVQARRQDAFDRLHSRGALSEPALAAIRRLQSDFAHLHRTGLGVRDFTPRVDGGGGPGVFAQRRLEAGARIHEVLSLTGPASANLLKAVCEAAATGGVDLDWRAIVLTQTSERLADAQGAVLRAAAENLAGAYRALDRARRAARAD